MLAAQVTPFEEVRDVLTDELAMDRARRAIAGRREQIDDLLASGATLEEIAAETPMELGTMEFGPDSADGIAAYAGFRDAANRVTVDDFPELIELEDGGLVALRLDALLDPALLPFEEVADRVRENWIAAETLARLTAPPARASPRRATSRRRAPICRATAISTARPRGWSAPSSIWRRARPRRCRARARCMWWS